MMKADDHVKPGIGVLSPEQIEYIHTTSLRILADVGIRVDSERAVRIFKAAQGVRFIDDRRVTLQAELVEWAIQQAPATIDIYNRRGELSIRLGDAPTRFGIGVTNLFYQDPASDEIIPFARRHMRSSVQLGNRLPCYDVISTIGILRDVVNEIADLVGLLEMLANTFKPLIILISDKEQFKPGLVLLENLVGDLSSKPFVIPYFNPVTPLIFNEATANNMLVSIERGVPIIFSNYGMAGMSTPITAAGTLALLNAELLAGLVFSQLVRPGTPVILGSLPAFFDMKTMVDFYDPQTMLLNLACAEMMAHYQIPHAGTSGSSNGWGADLVASQTLCINHLTSCLGKVGLAPFVGGCFGSKVFSPTLAVYAHEIIEQARQFAQGFDVNEETMGYEGMVKAAAAGSFLSSPQTTQLFRSAYHSSKIFPRLSLEKWQEGSQLDSMGYLRERTIELINHPEIPGDQADLLQKGEFLISHGARIK
jgi:trimethylamine:corrinoid methyltransferase-like protein